MRYPFKGSVTILCCLCLTICISCIGVFLESARLRGLVSRLDRTANSSLESVMADYNKNLLERYNLFVLDYGVGDRNEKELLRRWKTYFNKESSETMNNLLYQIVFDAEWFAIKPISYRIDKVWTLGDKDGKLFANQVAQYMKYKEVGNIVSVLLEQLNLIEKGIEGQKIWSDSWKNKEQQVKRSRLAVNLNTISEETLIGEYILEYFSCYTDKKQEEQFCQQEYILFGLSLDEENMKHMKEELLKVRCGLNLISILSSETMQTTIETTAMAISSGLLNPELAPLFQIGLNAIWVYKESERDVERLLKGEKIPFLKEESQWVESILAFGQNEETEEEFVSVDTNIHANIDSIKQELKELGENNKKWHSIEMDYEDYMRIFLLLLQPELKYERMMDRIELEMKKTYPSFQIENCICGVEVSIKAKANQKFFMFMPTSFEKEYELTRKVGFVY